MWADDRSQREFSEDRRRQAPAPENPGGAVLRHTEATYRALVEQIPGLLYLAAGDKTGSTLYVSPQIETLLGFSPAEWLADRALWSRQLHPEDRERVLAAYVRSCTTGDPFQEEYRLLARDGHAVWFRDAANVVRDEHDRALFLQGVMLDITEQKQAEEALREAQQRYRRLFEEAPVMYVITRDHAGAPIISDCNELFLRTLGYSRDELLGRPLADFYTPASRALLESGGYQRALRGSFLTEERELRARDGSVIPALLRAVPEFDPDGQVSSTRAMYVDITARKRAEGALEQRTSQLEAVRVVSAEITSELNLSALLDLILRRALELVGATAGEISLYDETAQVLVLQAGRGLAGWTGEAPIRLGEGVAGHVAERREGLIVNEYRTSPYARSFFLKQEITAVMAEPLLYRTHLLGVITVANREAFSPFAEDDRAILRLFAHQAAIAIENARLHAATLRRTEQLEAVMEVSRDVVGERPLPALLEDVVRRAVQLIGAHSGTLYRWDAGGAALCPHAWVNLGDYMGTVRYPAGRGLTGRVAETGQGQIWNDYPAQSDHDAQVLQHIPLTAAMAAPLKSRDRLLGVLTLNDIDPTRQFSPEDLRLLETFASQMAIAIENAELYEARRRAAIQLEALVEDRTRELKEANRRLEEASRHKSEFLAAMSHELRTPLNVVLGFSELLLAHAVGPLTEKQARYLGHIHTSGQHLLQLISDILDLAKVEAGKFVLQPEPLPVAQTLEDLLVIARGLANRKGQTLQAAIAPELPPLVADPVRFKQILFNLLSNAVKFTPDGGRITVTACRVSGDAETRRHGETATGGSRETETGRGAELSAPRPRVPASPCRSESDFLQIAVADTGVGIREEDLPKLFQEFVQLRTAAEGSHEGTGLGLALTKRLVELHGGRIWAESAGEGKGSAFSFLLPFAGPDGRGQEAVGRTRGRHEGHA